MSLITEARSAEQDGNDKKAFVIWNEVLYQSQSNKNRTKAAFSNLARLCLKHKLLDEAEAWALRGLEHFPGDLHLSLHYANTAIRQKNWLIALERIEPLSNKHPESLPAQLQLANCLLMLGRLTEAELTYDQIGKDFTDCVPALVGCARIAARRKNTTREISCWHEVMALDKTNPGALAGLANVCFLNGRFSDASLYFNRLVEAHPTRPQGYVGRARIAQHRQEWSKAIEQWNAAIRVSPENVNYYLNVIDAHLQLAEIDSADLVMKQAETRFSDDYRLLMANARLLSRKHDYPEARRQWTVLQKTFPDNVDVLGSYAQYLGQWGSRKQYKTALDAVLKIDNAHLKSRLGLACYRILQEQGAEALAILNALLLSPPRQSEVLFLKCRAEMLCGDYFAAEDALKQILNHESDSGIKIHAMMQLLTAKIRSVDTAGFDELSMQIEALASDPEIKPAFNEIKAIVSQIRDVYDKFFTDTRALEELKQCVSREWNLNPPEFLRRLNDIFYRFPDYFPAMQLLTQRLHQYQYLAKYTRSSHDHKQPQSPKNIPKRMIQYWDTKIVPDEIKRAMATWVGQYPDWQHEIFDDRRVVDFLEHHYGTSLVDCFRACYHPAMKSDLFRHSYLFKMGGLYVDADEVCLRRIEFSPDIQMVVRFQDQTPLSEFLPGFYAIAPNHPMLSSLLDELIYNLKNQTEHNHWFSVGPGLFTRHVVRHLTQNGIFEHQQMSETSPDILILTQSEYQSYAITPEFTYKHTGLNWLKSQHP